MTRMRKVICLTEMDQDIVWDYYQGPKQGRIFILEINGQKFKRTPADQMKANKIIDEMFSELAILNGKI